MVGIAGGVLGILEIEIAIVGSLGVDTAQETIALCGLYLFNEAFLRLEIERHALTFIVFTPLLIDGSAFHGFACAIGYPLCMDNRRVHVERNKVSTQIHVLIVHLGFTIQMSKPRGGIIDQGVFCCVIHGCFQARTLTSGVELGRISQCFGVADCNGGVAAQGAAQTIEVDG